MSSSQSTCTLQFLFVRHIPNTTNAPLVNGPFSFSLPSSASIADFARGISQEPFSLDIWKLETPLEKSRIRAFKNSGLFQQLVNFDSPLTSGDITMEYMGNRDVSLSECWDPSLYSPDVLHFVVITPIMAAPAAAAPVVQTGVVNTQLVTKYRSIFLTVSTFGSCVTSDLGLSKIVAVSGDDGLPPFVQDFETKLADESRLAPNADAVTVAPVVSTEGAGSLEHPQSDSGHDSMSIDTQMSSQNQQATSSQGPLTPPNSKGPSRNPLALHYIKSMAMPWERYWNEENPVLEFKQQLVNALFFLPLLPYFPNDSPLRVHMNKSSWPFRVLMEKDRTGMPAETRVEFQSYLPRSDFCVTRGLLPRMAVGVSPTPWPKQTDGQSAVYPYDLTRMLLSGAFVVRLANGFLNDFKEEKKFIFTCIYVSRNRDVRWYTLFQKADRAEVFYTEKVISFENGAGRAEVLLRLFNLVDYLGDLKEQDGETEKIVKILQERFREHHAKFPMPTFSQNSSRNRESSTRRHSSASGDSDSTREGNGRTNVDPSDCDDLIAHGYELEFESELPPYLHMVSHASKPGVRLIAKRVPRDSDEITILKFIRTLKVQSEHIITLLNSFRGESGHKWAVFPNIARTLAGCIDDEPWWLTSHVPSVCWGLVEGVAYLHQHNIAHRDLKPSNLVIDNDYVLKIIDFGIAIRVRDEDEEVSEHCGTDGWIAPEVEEASLWPYSPVKADRWSCGRVIIYVLDHAYLDGLLLAAFARRLTDDSPDSRPSLLEWEEWHDAPALDTFSTLPTTKRGLSPAASGSVAQADAGLDHPTKRTKI